MVPPRDIGQEREATGYGWTNRIGAQVDPRNGNKEKKQKVKMKRRRTELDLHTNDSKLINLFSPSLFSTTTSQTFYPTNYDNPCSSRKITCETLAMPNNELFVTYCAPPFHLSCGKTCSPVDTSILTKSMPVNTPQVPIASRSLNSTNLVSCECKNLNLRCKSIHIDNGTSPGTNTSKQFTLSIQTMTESFETIPNISSDNSLQSLINSQTGSLTMIGQFIQRLDYPMTCSSLISSISMISTSSISYA